jgi:hypothetical protein
MTNEIKQERMEQLDLGEKPFRKILEAGKPSMSYTVKKGDYSLYVTYEEGLRWGNEGVNSSYYQKGTLSLSHDLEWEFSEQEFVYGRLGSRLKFKCHDFIDTFTLSRDFAEAAHGELKSRNVWVEPEKVASFVYEALEPVRKRRKDLSELVMGVDFELPKEGETK